MSDLMTMEPCRVVLVDDHSLFRSGLKGLLDRCAGVRVVGEAALSLIHI